MTTETNTHSLKRNSVSWFGALATSAAFMGPGVSVVYNMRPAAGAGGAAFPLSFVLSMIAILFIAGSVIAFSRRLNSAGFAFTFTRAGLGARAGFMAGWVVLLAYAMISPLTYAGFGAMLSEFLDRQFGIHIPWVVFFVAVGLCVTALSLTGVNHSTRATLVFLVLEITSLAALYASVLTHAGAPSQSPFDPSIAPHGVFSVGAGMIFGILSFTGFEAAANLGEEIRDAHKNIPRAITLSVLLIGVFYIIGAYIADVAFGLNAERLANDPAPFDTIARQFWGDRLAWIITITALNSVFANAVAGQLAMVRNLFSLGRAGILPQFLGRATARGVPVRAIAFDFCMAMVLGLSFGLWKGPWAVWTLFGTIMSIGLTLIYGAVNLALPFYFLRHHRGEFSVAVHAVCPAIGILLLVPAVVGSIWPMPEFPFNLAPYVIGAWLVAGLIYLLIRRATGKEPGDQFGIAVETPVS